MTQLCLVRHGQTDWNIEGRYMGQSDVPLNQVGRDQAYSLARQLQGRQFAAVYTSDLARASETADIIASSLGLPVVCDVRLREINQGQWEGQLVEIIKSRYARLWLQRSLDPAGLRPPGGETVAEVAQRIQAALDEISHLHPGLSVLIVSHGLALATALCKVRLIPVGQAYTVIPENAEPVWVEWDEV
jgi:broad specificity phosphatase PhoE